MIASAIDAHGDNCVVVIAADTGTRFLWVECHVVCMVEPASGFANATPLTSRWAEENQWFSDHLMCYGLKIIGEMLLVYEPEDESLLGVHLILGLIDHHALGGIHYFAGDL